MRTHTRHELLKLTEAVIEDYATQEDYARLEAIVLSDPECLEFYLKHLELHGNLYWDAAGRGHSLSIPESDGMETESSPKAVFPQKDRRRAWAPRRISTIAASVLTLLAVTGIWLRISDNRLADPPVLVETDDPRLEETTSNGNDSSEDSIVEVHLPERSPSQPQDETLVNNSHQPQDQPQAEVNFTDDQAVVEFINHQLASTWNDLGIDPAPQASDEDWVRRIFVDLAGRIPTPAEVKSFLSNSSPDKRTDLVDSLLASREFSYNFASVWTNLLVGRSREREIDREELFAYLERQFGENRAWTQTVHELLTATGSAEESGPANYLLAHLNNEAVPATAITARIFLCEQLQCTQCHRHPIVSEWGQNRFWEINAFFQQTEVRNTLITDQKSGEKIRKRVLTDEISPEVEPAYYESLQGVMQVAYPRFAGEDVTPEESVSLRARFANLFASEQNPQLAVAFVNRTWQQLFGFAFTQEVDDMGPHSDVSHPELLSGLRQAFEETGYDVRRLMRWICLSDAYQLSSTASEDSNLDEPEAGGIPYFSRMYTKPFSAEQLFNSLMIAAGVPSEELTSRGDAFEKRENWLQQFFIAMDNEENSESTTFDGSITHTLMMINGDLVQQATDLNQSRVLRDIVVDPKKSETDRINELCLAALSRYPTEPELEAIRKTLRNQIRLRTSQNIPAKVAVGESLRDLYWAFLNSSEFSVNR
ncbi:hypothetical protein KOR42_24210 [Thalassoglobus neptunius]|uniref:DUF1549 domain-containing protein n=1 Tax=Thalassoglobus neptunius TaxID=1938619 RepID=A0A5C5XAX0_9PLAN|nr:DUF1553 domain-containing protein [Thalassoglobus neptunius]TWT59032.1 hypothetical protein KOR42_24210 [Thalassoglobus neptunius]